ncbi:hypothetical protein BGX20_007933, partial [Mortierella sp. AD010]
MSNFGARWPLHCPNPMCQTKHCAWHKNSVPGKNGLQKRVYRRACGKHTVSCEDIIKTLGHHDKPLSSQVMPTYFTQPIATLSSPSTPQQSPTAAPSSLQMRSPSQVITLNGNNSLHVSDLDAMEHEQDGGMFEDDSDEDSFKDVPTL